MLGGRPAGLKARIWLDAFFNDQRSPQVPAASFQVPDILFRGASPRVVFETAHAHAHVRPPACIYQSRVPVRTYKLLPCRARKPTAGDCEGGGGRQPHLSHGARTHRHRRPGSPASARTHPPDTAHTATLARGQGCMQKHGVGDTRSQMCAEKRGILELGDTELQLLSCIALRFESSKPFFLSFCYRSCSLQLLFDIESSQSRCVSEFCTLLSDCLDMRQCRPCLRLESQRCNSRRRAFTGGRENGRCAHTITHAF